MRLVFFISLFFSLLMPSGASAIAEAPGWLGPPKKAPVALCQAIMMTGIRMGVKDPKLSLAIAWVESSYRNVVSDDGQDLGYFQINRHTATIYGMDQTLLMQNIIYQAAGHFIILQDKLKHCAHLKQDAFSCYHSTTPKHRIPYAERVKKAYKQIPSFAEACYGVD